MTLEYIAVRILSLLALALFISKCSETHLQLRKIRRS